MKKVLLTGANGLLGQALVNLFRDDYMILLSGQEEENFNTNSDLDYWRIDITHMENCKELIKFFSPDIIINAASFTNVDDCESNKELCWQVNVKGVENLAHLSRRYYIHLIHYSTDYVFDGKNGPYSESQRPSPIGYYGKSKLASENVLRQIGSPSTIIRTCVLFGTGYNVKKNFFLWVFDNLKMGEHIRVVTDQFNNPTLVEDLAIGTKQVIERSALGLYHMGGLDYVSRYEFARLLANTFDFSEELIAPIKTNELGQKANRPLKGGLKIDLAQTDIGYNPRKLMETLLYLKLKMRENGSA
jgi:dTDP-4-dehydrorhamnose reductase